MDTMLKVNNTKSKVWLRRSKCGEDKTYILAHDVGATLFSATDLPLGEGHEPYPGGDSRHGDAPDLKGLGVNHAQAGRRRRGRLPGPGQYTVVIDHAWARQDACFIALVETFERPLAAQIQGSRNLVL